MSLKNLSVTTKIPKILKDKLNNKRVNQIYKNFEKTLKVKENFAVAVSGGPDSLALAFLAKIYSLKNRLSIKYLLVDHKLRTESTKEAKKIQKLLKNFSINLEILTWKGKKPSKNIQSVARNKRYKLLFRKCERYKIKHILLGHHQDDLFENFFIRMLRGSGLKGLISLDKKNILEKKILLRPLLDQKKDDLIYLSKNVFNFYVEDPTNIDEKYQRIKVRNIIKKFENEGLDKRKFLKTINNLKLSNSVIKFYVNKNLEKNTFFSKKSGRLILNKQFFLQPYEIVFRALSETLKIIGKKYYATRGKKLEKMITNLENSDQLRVTLGGCIIEKVNQTVIISKEH
jgi:tRNA(Ile)-lysidine synthase